MSRFATGSVYDAHTVRPCHGQYAHLKNMEVVERRKTRIYVVSGDVLHLSCFFRLELDMGHRGHCPAVKDCIPKVSSFRDSYSLCVNNHEPRPCAEIVEPQKLVTIPSCPGQMQSDFFGHLLCRGEAHPAIVVDQFCPCQRVVRADLWTLSVGWRSSKLTIVAWMISIDFAPAMYTTRFILSMCALSRFASSTCHTAESGLVAKVIEP